MNFVVLAMPFFVAVDAVAEIVVGIGVVVAEMPDSMLRIVVAVVGILKFN